MITKQYIPQFLRRKAIKNPNAPSIELSIYFKQPTLTIFIIDN